MPVQVRSVGTVASGIGSITPGLPAGTTTNDILVMPIESAVGQTNHAVSGWNLLSSFESADSKLEIWWIRHPGTLSAPSINDTGDHQIARIIAFSGCVTSGSPWANTQTIINSSGTLINFTVPQTDVTNTMLVLVATSGRDANSTTEFSGWEVYQGLNLTPLITTEQMNNLTNAGTGGGFGMATAFVSDLITSTNDGSVGALAILANSSASAAFAGTLIGTDSYPAFEGWGTAI